MLKTAFVRRWHGPNERAGDLMRNPASGLQLWLQAMADNEFWEAGDVALMKAWVKDLQAIGYNFPTPRRQRQPVSMAPLDVAHPTPKHWCSSPYSHPLTPRVH